MHTCTYVCILYIYKHILYYILYYLKFIHRNISAIKKALINLPIVTVMMILVAHLCLH